MTVPRPTSDAAQAQATATQADAVDAFLRRNPGWLAARPELYGILSPPRRVHGEAIADHMAAMVLQARDRATTMAAAAETILATSRASQMLLVRVHGAVLALLACPDPAEFVTGELPRLLHADVACLCTGRQADRLGALLGTRDVTFRTEPDDARILYDQAAPLALHDVLVRLPGHGVLALAGRDPICPRTGTGPAGPDQAATSTAAIQFLGRAVAAALLARPPDQ